MTTPVWQTPAGFLGTVTEHTPVSITLSVDIPATFSLISGNPPSGLTVSTSGIISGTPASIGETVRNQFVIRAADSSNTRLITDRTFTMDVTGLSNLEWVTPAGFINAGFGNEYYVINKESVDFQFIANAGQISYTLSTSSDVLVTTLFFNTLTNVDLGQPNVYRQIGGIGIPPGTTLTNISTVFNPIFNGYAIGISLPTTQALSTGSTVILYDTLPSKRTIKYFIEDEDGQLPPGLSLDSSGRLTGTVTDNLALNYQSSLTGGYDSEQYDGYPYDHWTIVNGVYTQQVTKYIPKTYQFRVTATDGIQTIKQLFFIEVVDPTNLTSDGTFTEASGPLSAESSYMVLPNWLTPTDLGSIRAQNKDIIQLNNYDPYPNTGPKSYSATAEARWMPYTSYNEGDWVIYYQGGTYFNGNWDANSNSPSLYNGQTNLLAGTEYIVSNAGVQNLGAGKIYYQVGDLLIYDGSIWNRIPNTQSTYVCLESHIAISTFDPTKWQNNQLPPYYNLDNKSGALYATIPYLPIYVKKYSFTIRLTKQDLLHQTSSFTNRTFSLTILGETYNPISFASPQNLGVLNIGYLSELSIKAVHANAPISTKYTVVGGNLPPGLTLGSDGSIIGRIDYGTVTGQYNFTVKAEDLYQQSITQDFYIVVSQYNNNQYTQIYLTPFFKSDQKSLFNSFISDTTIFDRSLIYRPDDPNFGVQNKMKLYLEYGIQQAAIDDYFTPTQNFFYNRNLWLGNLKVNQAVDLNGNHIYDVVYLDITEDKLDTYGQSVIISNKAAYPNSINNMRYMLENMLILGETRATTDEYQLPLWMRTFQNTGSMLGYTASVVLCYALPNMGTTIVKNIEKYGIDFSKFNFEIDRMIVESNLTRSDPAYVIFPKFGVNETNNGYYLYLDNTKLSILLDLNNDVLTIQ